MRLSELSANRADGTQAPAVLYERIREGTKRRVNQRLHLARAEGSGLPGYTIVPFLICSETS